MTEFWRYLAGQGDYYAALSFETTSNPNSFLYKYGKAVWNANGRDTAVPAYQAQYLNFETLQAANYLSQIARGAQGGAYALPNTNRIEEAYAATIRQMNSQYGAGINSGYVGHATFSAINSASYGLLGAVEFNWPDFLGVPENRRGHSTVTPFNDVSAGQTLRILEGTLSALYSQGYQGVSDLLNYLDSSLNPFSMNFLDADGNPVQLAYQGGDSPLQFVSYFANATEAVSATRRGADYSGDPTEIVVTATRDVVVNGQSFRIRYKQDKTGRPTYELDNPGAYNAALAKEAFSSFGMNLLSGIGATIFDDQISSIAASSFLGRFGSLLLNQVSQKATADIAQGVIGAKDQAARDFFGTGAGQTIIGIGSDVLSSYAILELGNQLGLKGFGASLFATAGQGLASQITSNALNIGAGQLSADQLFSNGLNLDQIFDAKSGVLGAAAIGSFFGRMVGNWIMSPTNTVGSIAASALSAGGSALLVSATMSALPSAAAAGAVSSTGIIGSIGAAFASFGPVAGPLLASGVGALVGFVLGAVFGSLFGRKKARIPTANAEITLNVQSGYWQTGAISAANGGNRELVSDMATASVTTLNSIINVVVGGQDLAANANASQAKARFGHTGSTIWYDRWNGSWLRQYSGADAATAVDMGVMESIRTTRIKGGDLLMKRAILFSKATTATGLAADLAIADDYATYLRSREFYNRSFAADPTSEATAAWLATLLRAGELGLTGFAASDFYGGLAGFANSFGFGENISGKGSGLPYEALTVSVSGADVRIATNNGSKPFGILAGSNDVVDPDLAAQSVLIRNFASHTGYTLWAGQATAGNDIWDASAGGPVTMDDSSYTEEWRWNPWDYTWEPYYTYVSGGDDIFIGSAHADSLFGRSGWDWLDGGAGDDYIDGGEQDDVILGRAGRDLMFGGVGNDYLSGGDGDDYWSDANTYFGLFGGDGDDILAGGAGLDSLYGENGDDTIIVDQDGGSVWDALGGAAGQDTLSYERFTSGVYIDFSVLGGWSWDPTAKYIYGDAISGMENITGSQHNDVIFGDSAGNVIRGLGGNDQLMGRDGDDVLEGGMGADSLQGGSGVDTASYAASSGGVIVSLLLRVRTHWS